jgi:hypothetical protein
MLFGELLCRKSEPVTLRTLAETFGRKIQPLRNENFLPCQLA